MRANRHRNNNGMTPEQYEQRRGLIYAVALHVGLLLVVLLGLISIPKAPNPVQIELWAEGEMAIAENMDEPITEPEPEPEVEVEPTPEPEPEPIPEPEPEPTPEPPPAPEAEPEPTPPPVEDPDIALEEARKEKAEAERKAKAKAEAEQKAKEKAEAERAAKAKAEAEQKAKEKAEAERVAKAKAEAEQKAKEKAEAERVAKAKAEAEQKVKAAAAAKAKAEAESKAKAAAAAQAKAEANRKAKEDAFRAAMAGAGKEVAGAPGGTANRNQAGGSGGDDGYGAKVRACVRPRVIYNAPPRNAGQNPTLQYHVDLNGDGTVRNVRITRSSGIALFDDAVQKGIAKCSPFPKPTNGRYPPSIAGEYRMYD